MRTSSTTRPHPGGTFDLSGRLVARIGYGAMQLVPHGTTEPKPDRASAIAVLQRAVELGVDLIDTAEFYGGSRVNAIIREALHPYPEHLVIATKVGADHSGSGLVPAQKPHELRTSVEANLRPLDAERVDVVHLRRVDVPPGIVAEGDQIVDIDSQLAELIALRDEGKIGAIGLSHVSADQVAAAADAGIVSVQNLYSAIARDDEALLEHCVAHGIAWSPYFPLGSAFPGRPRVTDEPAVTAAAERLGATPAQVGLAWLLQHAPNVVLIPGTTSVEHLEQNLAVGDLELDAEAVEAIDALAAKAAD